MSPAVCEAGNTCPSVRRTVTRKAWRIGSLREGLVVANQAGKDRQTGGVGAGPTLGPASIFVERPDRTGPRLPAPALRVPARAVELEEQAVVLIDDQQVAIALDIPVAWRAALDPAWLAAGQIGIG